MEVNFMSTPINDIKVALLNHLKGKNSHEFDLPQEFLKVVSNLKFHLFKASLLLFF